MSKQHVRRRVYTVHFSILDFFCIEFSFTFFVLVSVSGGKSHLRKTASKKPLESSTIEYFEQSKIWKMENDFYEFANKVFQDAKKRALIMKDGVLEPVKKQFFYEKIRPK